jgi:hypothetical protein
MVALLLWSLACGPKPAIQGQILDPSGRPVDKAVVALRPGNVKVVTDSDGRFIIDYLRAEDGSRTRLSRRTRYELEAFRLGYHPRAMSVDYRGGALLLDPVQLDPDTIRLQWSGEGVDPAELQERATAAGAAYEGE